MRTIITLCTIDETANRSGSDQISKALAQDGVEGACLTLPQGSSVE